MKRLIDSKLVKKVKAFFTRNDYNEEANTTGIGGNLEIDGNLYVNSNKVNGQPIITSNIVSFKSLKYEDNSTTCNFDPIPIQFSNKGTLINQILHNNQSGKPGGLLYGIYCFKFSSPAPSSLSVHTISGVFTPESDFVKKNGLWTLKHYNHDLAQCVMLHRGVAILTDSQGNSKTYRILMHLEADYDNAEILLYDPSKENGESFDFINPSALTNTNAITFIF